MSKRACLGTAAVIALTNLGLVFGASAAIAIAAKRHMPAPIPHTTGARLISGRSEVLLEGRIVNLRRSDRYTFIYQRERGVRRSAGWVRASRTQRNAHVTVVVRNLAPDAVYTYELVVSTGRARTYGATLSVATGAAQVTATAKPPGTTTPAENTASGTTTSATNGPPTTSTTPTPSPPTPTSTGSPPASTATPTYWGAEVGEQFTPGARPPWDMTGISDFANLVGKAPSIVPFNIPFITCDSQPCSWYSFPTAQMSTIRSYGSIPMLNWSSMSSPLFATEPGYTLADVANGDFDSYIKQFASDAAAWGHPFFLRFDWEMNGNWFPWGEAGNGNQPGQFVAAWQHVHDLFVQAGATNVSWVWCPSITTTNATVRLSELYPGDSYVDWTCLDGYNWGGLDGPTAWQSFSQVFSASYSQIAGTIAPTKPMMIGEVASTELGGSKSAWITDMFNQLATNYPDIRAFIWFEATDGADDWPVETSTSSTDAFKTGIAAPNFMSNVYGSLAESPITPPS